MLFKFDSLLLKCDKFVDLLGAAMGLADILGGGRGAAADRVWLALQFVESGHVCVATTYGTLT